MTNALDKWINQIHVGDCRDLMQQMIADGVQVQSVITSPPYYRLRNYGTDGQIGLEDTPQNHLEVIVGTFDLVKKLLRPDGTLWLNYGDSYASGGGSGKQGPTGARVGRRVADKPQGQPPHSVNHGFKSKDLYGMGWRIALAMQAPRYTGFIKNSEDRAWLAAIIDGEGCFFIHKRKAGTSAHTKFTKRNGVVSNYLRTADTYGVGLEICNTSRALIDRVDQIVGCGTSTLQTPAQNGRRKQTIFRWRVAPNLAKRIAQEVYPHLVAKQHQARLLFNCPSKGKKAALAHAAMMDLHQGRPTKIDYPAPPTLFESGWYFRSPIIFHKSNPMPESSKDRPTTSHEYLFLMAKSRRYYYDPMGVREPLSPDTHRRLAQNIEAQAGSRRAYGGTEEDRPMKAVHQKRIAGWQYGPGEHSTLGHATPKRETDRDHEKQMQHLRDVTKFGNRVDVHVSNGVGFGHGYDDPPKDRAHRVKAINAAGEMDQDDYADDRGLRTVWKFPTEAFKGAHFATFPRALVERCILLGSKPGDIVFDPYAGTGTVAEVAAQLGRRYIGVEINSRYVAMFKRYRSQQLGLAL